MLQWWYGYSDADREGFVEYMNEHDTQTGLFVPENKMLDVTQKFNWSLEQYEFVLKQGYAGPDGLVLHLRKLREESEIVDPLSDQEGVLGGASAMMTTTLGLIPLTLQSYTARVDKCALRAATITPRVGTCPSSTTTTGASASGTTGTFVT